MADGFYREIPEYAAINVMDVVDTDWMENDRDTTRGTYYVDDRAAVERYAFSMVQVGGCNPLTGIEVLQIVLARRIFFNRLLNPSILKKPERGMVISTKSLNLTEENISIISSGE